MKPSCSIPSIQFFTLVFFTLGSTYAAQAQVSGKLQAKLLNEVSGLAVSSPNVLYVHNDSGDTSRFFAVDPQGKLLSTLYFKGDPKLKPFGVTDCEDIAFGPGPVKGKNYIYLGDIGDNGADRPYLNVYRFAQPSRLSTTMHLQSQALHLRYPNGPKDAETILIDPIAKQLIIVSKRQDTVGIFSTPLTFTDGDTITLQKKGSLFLAGTAPFKQVVSGDISRDGKQVLLKTYEKVYYWLRKGSEPIAITLQRKPIELPYTKEPQGEAIGFTPDGKGYYCISEGESATIYHYSLPENSTSRKH